MATVNGFYGEIEGGVALVYLEGIWQEDTGM
jgi:hypothetical protein